MKTRAWLSIFGVLFYLGMLPAPHSAHAQAMTVRGRVTTNPSMSECLDQAICERDIALGLYPEEGWVPPTAAVNVEVKGTDTWVKTDRLGNYEVTVPSPNSSLMFTFIGFSRVEVPVEGRSTIDVKLTPTPMPVIERLLELIMPEIHAMRFPDIDELAAEAGVNRETARDIMWLVLGNQPMMRIYPNERVPDYRFDSEEATSNPLSRCSPNRNESCPVTASF